MRGLALAAVTVILALSLFTSCSDGADPGGPRGASGLPLYSIDEEVRIDGHRHNLVPIDTTIRVAVFEDGRMAIAQRQSFNVRFFSPEGEPIGSIGREGQGPGEFTTVHRLGWIADTLYAYDFNQRRFTLIDSGFNYIRYIYVPTSARPAPEMADRFPQFSTVFGGALYADGSVYGELAGANPAGLGDHDRTRPTYGRVAEDGTILSYFQFSTGPQITPVEVPVQLPDGSSAVGMVSPVVMPMPERPILRLADNGTRMAHLYVSMEGPNAGTFELLLEDVFEGPLYTRRYPFDPIVLTQTMRDSILADRFDGAPDDPIARVVRENAVFPPMIPPVVGMVHGADDRLWIRLADRGEERPYLILDSMGEPEAELVLPTHSRIAVADRSHIWVIERDDFGVESLLRYRFGSEDR
jgi:hypothetical protein